MREFSLSIGKVKKLSIRLLDNDPGTYIIRKWNPLNRTKKETKMNTSQVQIVTRKAFRVAGMRYAGKNEHAEIPKMWDEFIPRSNELSDNQDPGVFFGVARSIPGVPESEGFEYLAGVQVSTTTQIPAGMVAWEIPALTYAVLPANDVPGIAPVSDFFYKEWLPKSTEWEMGEGIMIEYYPPEYPQHLVIYLNFPVQPKKT